MSLTQCRRTRSPISVLSLFARGWFGHLMGHGAPLPLLLVFSNVATCLLGLLAGYTSPATRGMVRHGRRDAAA